MSQESVCPYSVDVYWHLINFLSFQFLQSNHKMSLIKVAWYVLKEKSMHSGPPSALVVNEAR